MNRIITLFSLLMIVLQSFAQKESSNNNETGQHTLFTGITSSGAYGATTYRYGMIGGRNAFSNGGRGAWIVNHKLALGAEGLSFRTTSENDTLLNNNYRITGGYGGFLFEPILFSSKPVHISLPVVLGVGKLAYSSKINQKTENNDEDSKIFWVVEPGIELELSVVSFFRLSFGAYYRFATRTELNYLTGNKIDVSSDALNNFSFGITFKFGKF